MPNIYANVYSPVNMATPPISFELVMSAVTVRPRAGASPDAPFNNDARFMFGYGETHRGFHYHISNTVSIQFSERRDFRYMRNAAVSWNGLHLWLDEEAPAEEHPLTWSVVFFIK